MCTTEINAHTHDQPSLMMEQNGFMDTSPWLIAISYSIRTILDRSSKLHDSIAKSVEIGFM